MIAASTTPRRVLVVEDHAMTRVLIEHALTHAGFHTSAVATAADAIDSFEKFDPDLLLSDIDLGGHPNGVELTTILHARAPYLAVVLMSNYGALQQVAGFRSLPKGTQFVRKESISDTNTLLEVLDSALRETAHQRGTTDATADPQAGTLQSLTRTQIEVLRLVAAGFSNTEIAKRRGTNIGAIEKVLTRIFRSLGFDTNPAVNPRVASAKEFIRVFGPVHTEGSP